MIFGLGDLTVLTVSSPTFNHVCIVLGLMSFRPPKKTQVTQVSYYLLLKNNVYRDPLNKMLSFVDVYILYMHY